MDVRVIGVPMDLGADRRGVDMGPSAIRYAGLGEAHTAMDRVDANFDAVRSTEVVEVNPILDSHNRTAELAVDLVGNALGERVL
jgi:arginase family enzyme